MNKDILRPHIAWLSVLTASLFLLALTPAVSTRIQEALEKERTHRIAKHAALSARIEQWKADAKEARELAAALGNEDVEAMIAPSSRTDMAAQLEPLADAARLTRLIYTLGPETPWSGDPAFPGMEGIAQSRLTLEAEAPTDADIFVFLKSLSGLPGRMDLERLSIERIGGPERQTIGAINLRFKAEILWIANESKGGHAR